MLPHPPLTARCGPDTTWPLSHSRPSQVRIKPRLAGMLSARPSHIVFVQPLLSLSFHFCNTDLPRARQNVVCLSISLSSAWRRPRDETIPGKGKRTETRQCQVTRGAADIMLRPSDGGRLHGTPTLTHGPAPQARPASPCPYHAARPRPSAAAGPVPACTPPADDRARPQGSSLPADRHRCGTLQG